MGSGIVYGGRKRNAIGTRSVIISSRTLPISPFEPRRIRLPCSSLSYPIGNPDQGFACRALRAWGSASDDSVLAQMRDNRRIVSQFAKDGLRVLA